MSQAPENTWNQTFNGMSSIDSNLFLGTRLGAAGHPDPSNFELRTHLIPAGDKLHANTRTTGITRNLPCLTGKLFFDVNVALKADQVGSGDTAVPTTCYLSLPAPSGGSSSLDLWRAYEECLMSQGIIAPLQSMALKHHFENPVTGRVVYKGPMAEISCNALVTKTVQGHEAFPQYGLSLAHVTLTPFWGNPNCVRYGD